MPSTRKSVIVTGGASGIGLAITKHFASQGAHITVLDVNTSTGQDVVKGVASEFPEASLAFKKCDISSWDELAAVFEETYQEQGHIDIVMANAGISREEKLIVDEEKPSKPGLKTLDVNLTGTIYTVKLAIHYLRKNKPTLSQQSNGTTNGTSTHHPPSSGSIICTASNAGIYPFPVAPIYGASKSGVIGLVRSLARPLAKENIQINALAPAVLETNIAPSKDLFKPMILTPMSTLTRGVQQYISDPSLTGCVAEIHGDHVTLSPPQAYVDADSERNLETFWSLGYA